MNTDRDDNPVDLRALSDSAWNSAPFPAGADLPDANVPENLLGGDFIPFPIGVLPAPLAALVREGAKAIQCDACFLALPLLSSLGAAIGNTCRLRVSNTWHAPPIIWAAIVGVSGSGKSPAYRLVLKALRAAQTAALKEHRRAVRDFDDAQLVYETKLATWRIDQKRNTAADGYSVAPPEKPVCPPAKRYIVSDTTTEAITPILRDNPRGVLLARDEISGWLASFDRYAAKGGGVSADAAHWLSMHDGDELTIDRKTSTPPTIFVPSASVCITGGIQPGILAKSMTSQHRESGLMARILFAMPPRGRRRWTEADVSHDTEHAVADVFAQLLTLEADVVPDPDDPDRPDLRPVLIEMTPDAKLVWIDFYNEHNSQTDNLSDDESAAWSKLEGYVPRFALVIHLARWASGDPAVPTSTTPVDVDSIRAAIELVRWFARETFRVYARLGESEDQRDLRELAAWIKSHGGAATARDLRRGPQKYRDNPVRARADLDRLVKAGMAEWEVVPSGPDGGKPTDRVRLISPTGDTRDGDDTP